MRIQVMIKTDMKSLPLCHCLCGSNEEVKQHKVQTSIFTTIVWTIFLKWKCRVSSALFKYHFKYDWMAWVDHILHISHHKSENRLVSSSLQPRQTWTRVFKPAGKTLTDPLLQNCSTVVVFECPVVALSCHWAGLGETLLLNGIWPKSVIKDLSVFGFGWAARGYARCCPLVFFFSFWLCFFILTAKPSFWKH